MKRIVSRATFAVLLALLLAMPLLAAPHSELLIRGMQDLSTLFTRSAGLVSFKCGAGMTCTWSNGVFSLTAPAPTGGAVGGASALTTGYVPVSDTVSTSLKNSKISCSGLGVCTIYDDTATTGSSTFVVRAGAGQSTANLQEWKNAAGAVLFGISPSGYLSHTSAIGGQRVLWNEQNADATKGPYRAIAWDTLFTATQDHAFSIGYNNDFGGGLVVAGEPSFRWIIEQDYEASAGTHYVESYFEWVCPAARCGTYQQRRPLFWQFDRATGGLNSFIMRSSGISFTRWDTNAVFANLTPTTFSLSGSTLDNTTLTVGHGVGQTSVLNVVDTVQVRSYSGETRFDFPSQSNALVFNPVGSVQLFSAESYIGTLGIMTPDGRKTYDATLGLRVRAGQTTPLIKMTASDTSDLASWNVDGTITAQPGGKVPARKDYTFACTAKTTAAPSLLTSIVVATNAATATCGAGGCGLINGQIGYVIGATSDTDLNAAYTIAGSTGATDTTVTFTTANVADGTYDFASDAGMSLQGCLLNGASSTLGITAAVVIRPVLFSLLAGSKVIGNTVTWPAAWTGPGTLTASVGASTGPDDTFYNAASNLMAATNFLDSGPLYKSKVHATADNTIGVLTANTNFGDGTLPILKLDGSVTFSVTW